MEKTLRIEEKKKKKKYSKLSDQICVYIKNLKQQERN